MICTCGRHFRSSKVGLICDICLANSRAFKPPRRAFLRRVPAIVPDHADPRPPELRIALAAADEPTEAA
jgi:hypothetical protein